MKYNILSKYEKQALIHEVGFWREERHYAAEYLNALRTNNVEVIEQYEAFGNDPRHIVMNRREYDKRLLFGFTSKELDENGWLKSPEFLEYERIEFIHQQGWAAHNYVTIGRGVNGKWSYGVSYSTGGAGGGYGLGVWGSVCDSRKECLASALAELLDRHHESAVRLKDDTTNFNVNLSRKIVQQVKAMFDELTGRRGVQLSLFS